MLCGGAPAHDEREAVGADLGAKGQHGAEGAGRFSRVSGHHSRRAGAATVRIIGKSRLGPEVEQDRTGWPLRAVCPSREPPAVIRQAQLTTT